MSAGVDPARRLVARSMRAIAITWLFLCAGPLISLLMFIMTIDYCIAFSAGTEAVGAFVVAIFFSIIWIAGDLSWQLAAPDAAMAGFVGLAVGVGEMLSGRLNVRTVAALGVAIRTAWALTADVTSVAHLGTITPLDAESPWILFAAEGAAILSFGMSMIICWKIAGLVRLRRPAIAGLSPP